MKNDNVWLILAILIIALGALTFKNIRQDRFMFDEDFNHDYSEKNTYATDDLVENEIINNKTTKENTKTTETTKITEKSSSTNTSSNTTNASTSSSDNSKKTNLNTIAILKDAVTSVISKTVTDVKSTNTGTSTSTSSNATVNKNTEQKVDDRVKVATNDIVFEDLGLNGIYESGEYSSKDGSKAENRRRIRLSRSINVRASYYNVVVPDDVKLIIAEFGSSDNFIKSTEFLNGSKFTPTSNTKYFKITMAKVSSEKTMSPGQWGGYFQKGLRAYLYNGDMNKLISSWQGNLYSNNGSYTSESSLVSLITSNQGKNLANKLMTNQYINGAYSLNSSELGDRLTIFFSTSGDDNNSGLSPEYPKKTLYNYNHAHNYNILLKAGDEFYLPGAFHVGNNSLYATYGNGPRALISFYSRLNATFTKVSGYDDIWVADVSHMSNGTTNKSNVNIGQLYINGSLNWKRYVFSSDENFNPKVLKDYNNGGWSIDFKNSKLYIQSSSDPNGFRLHYAPALHGINMNGVANVVFKGIEIEGAGQHGISLKNSKNIVIRNNYIHDIGGSVLTSAGIRYGNAIQVWDSGEDIKIEYNIADWIFDTCFTNQGSDKDAVQKNIKFSKNIGMHSFWGIEVWGDGWSNNSFSNIEYSSNIIYFAMDITNPDTTMYNAPSGKVLHSGPYISYRGGYQYHQMSNLALSTGGTGENTKILNNVFAETNRFLIKLENSKKETVVSNLENNTFYNRTDNAVFRQSKTYTYDLCSAMSSTNKKADPTSHMTTLLKAMSR